MNGYAAAAGHRKFDQFIILGIARESPPGDPVSAELFMCRQCGTVVGHYHFAAYPESADDKVDGRVLHRCPTGE